jgi:hypothetical protein
MTYMKKIILPTLAVALALVCVSANAMMVITYYISNTAGIPSCVVQWTGTVCPPGSIQQCTVTAGDQTFWVSKFDSATGICSIHLRN